MLVALWLGYDMLRARGQGVECPDGVRRTIDVRDFATQYVGYGVTFEATLKDKLKFTGKVDPQLLQRLSEAVQQSNEFRKYVVHGYNACAVSRAQYAQYGARFQALSDLGRQIDTLAGQSQLSSADEQRLTALVNQYINLLQKAAAG
jgi:hypothetical protein